MAAETGCVEATVTGAMAIGVIVDRTQKSGIIPALFYVVHRAQPAEKLDHSQAF
jgi:hypothetical protein